MFSFNCGQLLQGTSHRWGNVRHTDLDTSVIGHGWTLCSVDSRFVPQPQPGCQWRGLQRWRHQSVGFYYVNRPFLDILCKWRNFFKMNKKWIQISQSVWAALQLSWLQCKLRGYIFRPDPSSSCFEHLTKRDPWFYGLVQCWDRTIKVGYLKKNNNLNNNLRWGLSASLFRPGFGHFFYSL